MSDGLVHILEGNTFVDNAAPCIQLSAGYNERGRSLLPEDVTVRDNVFVPPANNFSACLRMAGWSGSARCRATWARPAHRAAISS